MIRSDSRAELWLQGTPAPDRPLVRYVLNDFKTVATIGEFEFVLPKPTARAARRREPAG